MRKTEGRLGAAAGLLLALGFAAGALAQANVGRRADVKQSLEQRYRVTEIGPKYMGLSGNRGTIRKAGGVVTLRRSGLSGSLESELPASYAVREGAVTLFRGRQDVPLSVGDKFYVHSVHVGSDVITLGLLSARANSGPKGSSRLWAGLSFFFPPDTVADADVRSIYAVLDQWLLPEEGLRPVLSGASVMQAEPAAPPTPAAPAELKPGMSREEVEAALGLPARDVSFGARTWLSYPGMVVVLNEGKLVSVDRSGRPPAKVRVVSEPDGADVLLDGSYVSSTPATLELPAGTYQVRVVLPGYQDWEREVRVLGGSEVTVRARLEK